MIIDEPRPAPLPPWDPLVAVVQIYDDAMREGVMPNQHERFRSAVEDAGGAQAVITMASTRAFQLALPNT